MKFELSTMSCLSSVNISQLPQKTRAQQISLLIIIVKVLNIEKISRFGLKILAILFQY